MKAELVRGRRTQRLLFRAVFPLLVSQEQAFQQSQKGTAGFLGGGGGEEGTWARKRPETREAVLEGTPMRIRSQLPPEQDDYLRADPWSRTSHGTWSLTLFL